MCSLPSAGAFPADVCTLQDAIVRATIVLYNTVATALLPTPPKPHYTFNLRDVGKVVQGLLMSEAKSVPTVGDMQRLWIHECKRVFEDRLVNDEVRAGRGGGGRGAR